MSRYGPIESPPERVKNCSWNLAAVGGGVVVALFWKTYAFRVVVSCTTVERRRLTTKW
jgi:hypothetical protein